MADDEYDAQTDPMAEEGPQYRATVFGLLRSGLETDGAHHKQWYLWKIAEILGFTEEDFGKGYMMDKGIEP